MSTQVCLCVVFFLPHGASQQTPLCLLSPSKFFSPCSKVRKGFLRAKYSELTPRQAGLQAWRREGHVLWLNKGREGIERLWLPPKQQPCPGQLELGQSGMKPCLLLNKGTGTGPQREWALSSFQDLIRFKENRESIWSPDTSCLRCQKFHQLPPLRTRVSYCTCLCRCFLLPSCRLTWAQNHPLHRLTWGLIKVMAYKRIKYLWILSPPWLLLKDYELFS